tara:strand:+ start:491 stop:685 length:195 start_codon:yes stop_codon:yes gene_type:complete
MRDPGRIYRIASYLTEVWRKNPDLRLAQVISNAASLAGWENPDTFYLEDDKLEEGLTIMINKIK